MARLDRSHTNTDDRFFRVVHGPSLHEPLVVYLWFDAKGWLYGLIKLFATGRADIETATEAFPLSISPFELDEFEGNWPGAHPTECSADEYFAMAALVSKSGSEP